MDFIGNHHCDKLADSGQKQVGMERQAVGHEAELVGIAEMPVDVHLLDGGVDLSMGRHGGITVTTPGTTSRNATAIPILAAPFPLIKKAIPCSLHPTCRKK